MNQHWPLSKAHHLVCSASWLQGDILVQVVIWCELNTQIVILGTRLV